MVNTGLNPKAISLSKQMPITTRRPVTTKNNTAATIRSASFITNKPAAISPSNIAEAADAIAESINKDLPIFKGELDYAMKRERSEVPRGFKDSSGSNNATKDAVTGAMFGGLDESKSNRSGNTSESGGNFFGFSQETKETLKSAGENMMAAGSAIGGAAGLYAASSAAAITAATGGTAVIAVGAAAGVAALTGAAAWFLGKYGEWHPDSLGESGLAGVDPITGEINKNAAVKALPNEVYGGVISSGSSGIPFTKQELSLAIEAIDNATGGSITNPSPTNLGNTTSIDNLNTDAVLFQITGGGLIGPSLSGLGSLNASMLALM